MILTHDVERVFADVDADHGDRRVEFLRHGVLLVLSAPCQLLVLAGPEHGRTIPLAGAANAQWRTFARMPHGMGSGARTIEPREWPRLVDEE
ncbi:hypothetical protein WN72_45050 [Bradyrhizobium arachidis]|uniref:Uncharacterized protein n=1 Tax=Bradyrhizobium arachidis TaxID=858423 RepID=A0AAE7NVA8_9BRAD|nr:hypothetical protein WN72_45050 [Bradyrhizobium arachidis]